MAIITDKNGNMMNAEMIIEVERDPKELKLLASALLVQRNELVAILNDVADELTNGQINRDTADRIEKALEAAK